MLKYCYSVTTLLCLAAALAGCANGAFYHPNKKLYQTPAKDGYRYEEVALESLDGTNLHGWFVHSSVKALGTVVHFHGNAQNLSAHYSFVSWLPRSGYNVFLFDYRGYGRSEGRPSRKGLYEDSVAALEYVTRRGDVQGLPLFVFGQSLGGANAITAVGKNRLSGIDGILVDSAFASYRSVAKSKFGNSLIGGILKTSTPLLVSEGLDPIDWIGEISPIPIAIIHGTNDRVVPISEAEALYHAAKDPKEFWELKDGYHIEGVIRFRIKLRPRILEFFNECSRDPDSPAGDV